MSLHDKNKLGVTRKKQDEILIQVESIHHIQ